MPLQEASKVKSGPNSTQTDLGGNDKAVSAARRHSSAGVEMKTIQYLTGPAKPVKENETEVTTYDISQDFPSIKTHLFRARYVNVGPREVVPTPDQKP